MTIPTVTKPLSVYKLASQPEAIRGREYVNMSTIIDSGTTVHITGAVVSVYKARDKSKVLITTKDGDDVYKATIYLLIDDGTVTSTSSRAVLTQISAMTGYVPPMGISQDVVDIDVICMFERFVPEDSKYEMVRMRDP